MSTMTTSRLAARNSSGSFARAACAKIFGSRNQPPIASAATTSPPCHSVVRISSALSPEAAGDKAASTKMIGTSARSSNNSIEKDARPTADRSEEHTSELQSLMRISYAVFCLKKKKDKTNNKATLCEHKTTQTRHTRTTPYK